MYILLDLQFRILFRLKWTRLLSVWYFCFLKTSATFWTSTIFKDKLSFIHYRVELFSLEAILLSIIILYVYFNLKCSSSLFACFSSKEFTFIADLVKVPFWKIDSCTLVKRDLADLEIIPTCTVCSQRVLFVLTITQEHVVKPIERYHYRINKKHSCYSFAIQVGKCYPVFNFAPYILLPLKFNL